MRTAHNETGDNKSAGTSTLEFLARFARCDSGATSIEYGLICSLIFLAIVSAVKDVGSKTAGMHTKIQSSL